MKKVTSQNIRKHLRQGGFSMVELGLVLVISILLLVGVVRLFSSNSTTSQANSLAQDITMLVGKVKSAYSGQYANVTNAKLNTGGFFANYGSLTNTAGVVTTSLGGGTLTVSSGTVTAAGDSVKYVITQLPDESCLPLVNALAKTATTVTLGANTVKAAGAAPDPSKITCANDANTLTFQVQ